MNINIEEYLRNRNIELPNPRRYGFLMKLVSGWINVRFHPEYVYHFDTAEMRGRPVVLIADHAAWDSFYYVMSGYPFVQLNTVVGYQHVFNKTLFPILTKIFQVIPKKNFQTDLGAMRQIVKVAEMGGSLLVFPEGTQSKSGSNVPITPSTAGLLKKLGLSVVLCRSYGSYCARPLYSGKTNKGHQEFHYEILFTAEELGDLNKDQIYDRMLERFRYNDLEWNREKRYPYHCKDGNAAGIEKIVYTCPRCGEQFTIHGEGDEVVCSSCGNRILINEYYEMSPAGATDICPYHNIDDWYKDERRMIRKKVKAPDYRLEFNCSLYELETETLSREPYKKTGYGRVTIDHSGIAYRGIRRNEPAEINLDIKKVPSMLSNPGKFNLLYNKNEVFRFVPSENRNTVIRNMIVVEELYNLTDPVWNKVSEDAYYNMEK